jgi:hypothetical protein
VELISTNYNIIVPQIFRNVKISKKMFFSKKEKENVQNILDSFFKLESSKLINYSIDMCQSCQGIMVSIKRFSYHIPPQLSAHQTWAFSLLPIII